MRWQREKMRREKNLTSSKSGRMRGWGKKRRKWGRKGGEVKLIDLGRKENRPRKEGGVWLIDRSKKRRQRKKRDEEIKRELRKREHEREEIRQAKMVEVGAEGRQSAGARERGRWKEKKRAQWRCRAPCNSPSEVLLDTEEERKDWETEGRETEEALKRGDERAGQF